MAMLVLGSVVSFLLTVNLNVVLSGIFFWTPNWVKTKPRCFLFLFCIDVANKNNGNKNKLQKKDSSCCGN